MVIDLIDVPLSMTVYGVSGPMRPGQAWAAGQPLMDALWREVRTKAIPHHGKNIWVYDRPTALFVGVELLDPANSPAHGLERKLVILPRYLLAQHVGPYSLLSAAYDAIQQELTQKGFQPNGISVEIYGHERPDAEPEVDILVGLTRH